MLVWVVIEADNNVRGVYRDELWARDKARQINDLYGGQKMASVHCATLDGTPDAQGPEQASR